MKWKISLQMCHRFNSHALLFLLNFVCWPNTNYDQSKIYKSKNTLCTILCIMNSVHVKWSKCFNVVQFHIMQCSIILLRVFKRKKIEQKKKDRLRSVWRQVTSNQRCSTQFSNSFRSFTMYKVIHFIQYALNLELMLMCAYAR